MIKKILFDNKECVVEELVDMSFGVVDIHDGLVCNNNENEWRELRDYEKHMVDNKIHAEQTVNHSFLDKHDVTMSINDDLKDIRNEQPVRVVEADVYLDGVEIGFKL